MPLANKLFTFSKKHVRVVATACLVFGGAGAAQAENCMESDPTYWSSENRLPIYEDLMTLMACQANATPVEGQKLNDTSACNWFLTRALERAYGVTDFVPEDDAQWISANEIVQRVRSSDMWTKLGNASDQNVLIEAAEGARNGQPVIAVRAGDPHGHVALVLAGPLSRSSSWDLDVPNSASFTYSPDKIVDKAYVGCKLSYAFGSKDGVEIFWRLKAR
ncbi:hypothetical protein [Paracoccus sphaerophysae]|uniref:hypothetical protein n=1 Tax=Paracoccus sphaerophysae TaxID=690417 RepID=UPI0012EC173C|nr:hypothetical protein [Paracoccus sphaerophysae]